MKSLIAIYNDPNYRYVRKFLKNNILKLDREKVKLKKNVAQKGLGQKAKKQIMLDYFVLLYRLFNHCSSLITIVVGVVANQRDF